MDRDARAGTGAGCPGPAAGLARDAVVVGVLNRLEVWSPALWESFIRDSERLLDDVSLDIQWPLPAATPSGPVRTPSGGSSRSGDPQAKPNG